MFDVFQKQNPMPQEQAPPTPTPTPVSATGELDKKRAEEERVLRELGYSR
jgi:hypothetical protein